jgi:hypothetical protein
MRKRVPDDVVTELIDNDGCRRNSGERVSSTGVVRLALDLQEARAEAAKLKALLESVCATKGVPKLLDGGLALEATNAIGRPL